jgi:hypothetical protein
LISRINSENYYNNIDLQDKFGKLL